MRPLAPSLLALTAFIACVASCVTPAADDRFVQTSLPDRASFPPVAQLLAHRCGTLDCHGSSARNLRVLGSEGLRLSPNDRPLSPACSTPAEIDQDYFSLVGLEPEIVSAVVSDDGAHPERLTMVRKARGVEDHKGGTIWAEGGDEDTCLTSWFGKSPKADACERALVATACPTP